LKNKGFSLLELVITVGVLAIGIVFALQAFSTASKMTAVSADLTKAVFLANDKLQELEFLEKEGMVASLEPAARGEYGKYKWRYQIKPDEELSLYWFDLTINWQRGTRAEELSVKVCLR
jgi:prepilin-type N-terminal cleavage/methylation domain-containing protein